MGSVILAPIKKEGKKILGLISSPPGHELSQYVAADWIPYFEIFNI